MSKAIIYKKVPSKNNISQASRIIILTTVNLYKKAIKANNKINLFKIDGSQQCDFSLNIIHIDISSLMAII